MRLRVLQVDLYLTDCTTRLPFRFGKSTLTFAPLCTARVLIETEAGVRSEGYSADLLVPKWFEKDPTKSARTDVSALIHSAQAAGTLLTARDHRPATVFDHWWDLFADRVGGRAQRDGDLLVHGFGVALLERAMMDGACRAAKQSFFDALRCNLFGFDPGRVHSSLRRWDLTKSLPRQPADSIHVRHTIGLLDALRDREIDEADRMHDGFPESLEADIVRYALTHFKIKLSGVREDDLARLLRIAKVFESMIGEPAQFTIDGNELFDDLNELADLLDALRADAVGSRLLGGLLLIEQPLPRSRTLDSTPNAAIGRVEKYAPVLIDEADDGLHAFPRAAELGYRGVSVKNCKGVFRALINRGLCDLSQGRLFQSAEDLTTLPVLALQQDLATVAALGLTHVERNGHHYFRGLDHLSADEAHCALASHPDLYKHDAQGVSLRIEDGQLRLGSLQGVGFGYDVPICTSTRTAVDAWHWPE